MKKSKKSKKTAAKKIPVRKKTTKRVKVNRTAAKKKVKKTIRRKPAKKTTKKAKSPKRVKKIKEAPPELCFWVNNGPVVKSLVELKRALKQMNDGQFSFHTERDGNDFASWVKNVLGERGCAKEIEKAKTRTGTIRVITLFIR